MDLLIFLRNKKFLTKFCRFKFISIWDTYRFLKKKNLPNCIFFLLQKYKSIEGVWKHAVIPYPEKNHEHGVNLVVCVTPTPFQKILTE